MIKGDGCLNHFDMVHRYKITIILNFVIPVGPPTIKGDGRLNHFDTTHSQQFQAVSLPRIAAFPPPTGTNVPQGDKEKEATFQTLHQVSILTWLLDIHHFATKALLTRTMQSTIIQKDSLSWC